MTDRRTSKQGVAEFFDVSVVAVDAWIRRGCPYVRRGGRGKPWVFDLLEVSDWRNERSCRMKQPVLGDDAPPEVAEILERRPDYANAIRFFTEESIKHYLWWWLGGSTGKSYAAVVASFLCERGLSKADSIAATKDAIFVLYYGLSDWVRQDAFNLDVCEGGIDHMWRHLSGKSVATRPPIEDDDVTFQLPDWIELSIEDLVGYWYPQKEGSEEEQVEEIS